MALASSLMLVGCSAEEAKENIKIFEPYEHTLILKENLGQVENYAGYEIIDIEINNNELFVCYQNTEKVEIMLTEDNAYNKPGTPIRQTDNSDLKLLVK